jgi:hypothetical protein
MTTDHSRPEPGPDASIGDIEDDIEHTREELGETVGALTAKLDVKGRARQKAVDTKERLADKTRETKDVVLDKTQGVRSKSADLTSGAVNAVTDEQGSVKPVVPLAAVVAAAAVIVGILIWRRRR